MFSDSKVLENSYHFFKGILEGKSEEPNDVFTVRFQNGDMYKVKVSEMIPHKKITWEVIDSYQGWHKDQTVWVGTTIVWEVFSQKRVLKRR